MSKKQSPRARAFIDEILAVCKKHHLVISPDDPNGGLDISELDPILLSGIDAACDLTPSTTAETLLDILHAAGAQRVELVGIWQAEFPPKPIVVKTDCPIPEEVKGRIFAQIASIFSLKWEDGTL